MIAVLYTMFAWPQGIVVGNLIASAITSLIVVIRNEIHHKRLHERLSKMALTAQEKALLESLTAKANEPDAAPQYDSVPKILRYLVQTSSHFSSNPDDRQVMLDYLDSLDQPAETPAANAQAN